MRPWYVRAGIAAGVLLFVGAFAGLALRGRETAVSSLKATGPAATASARTVSEAGPVVVEQTPIKDDMGGTEPRLEQETEPGDVGEEPEVAEVREVPVHVEEPTPGTPDGAASPAESSDNVPEHITVAKMPESAPAVEDATGEDFVEEPSPDVVETEPRPGEKTEPEDIGEGPAVAEARELPVDAQEPTPETSDGMASPPESRDDAPEQIAAAKAPEVIAAVGGVAEELRDSERETEQSAGGKVEVAALSALERAVDSSALIVVGAQRGFRRRSSRAAVYASDSLKGDAGAGKRIVVDFEKAPYGTWPRRGERTLLFLSRGKDEGSYQLASYCGSILPATDSLTSAVRDILAGQVAPPERARGAERAPPPGKEAALPRVEPAGDRVRKDLGPEGVAEIHPLLLQRRTLFELADGERVFTVRASPDGLVEFLNVDVSLPVELAVIGAKGNEVNTTLQAGEEISAWPVALLTVDALADGFTVLAATIDWAFVVRAGKVRSGGLPAQCGDFSCVLREGERLDTDRFGDRVLLRQTGPDWPGSLVRLLAKSGSHAPHPEVRGAAALPPEEMYSGPVKPGVFPNSSRDLPWQSVPLPVIDR